MNPRNSVIAVVNSTAPRGRAVAARPLSLILGAALVLLLPAAPARAAGDHAPGADTGLVRQLRDELIALPGVDVSRVRLQARRGVVTLAGTVPNLRSHLEAVHAARMVRHVRGIIDLIDVAPEFRDNLELELAVRHALRLDPDAEEPQIGVVADDGVVTLSGAVASVQQHQEALAAARGVRGVARVKDQIEIHQPAARADQMIWTDVRRAIDEDLLLQPAVIHVAVDDGVVSLSGFVATSAQRAEALDLAWVSGVWKVRDRMTAASWAAEPGLRDTVYLPDDAALRLAVAEALRQDPRVNGDAVDVEVIAGTATLGGEASTLAEKQAAGQDAANTPGVTQTVNVLRVDPGPTGARLAARVKRALGRDPDLSRYALDVRASGGKVLLYGQVVNEFDHQAVMRAVARVRGVTAIQDDVVRNHADPLPPDERVAWRIRLWLRLSAPLSLRRVSVSVQDGVALLRGEVPRRPYRALAESIARKAGALRVRDRLVVQG